MAKNEDFDPMQGYSRGFTQDIYKGSDPVQPQAVLSSSTGLDALNDPQFISELVEYYGKKGDIEDPSDIEALLDEFYSDQTWDAMNSIAAAHDIYETKNMEDRQVLLKGRIKQVYDSLPNAFAEGGRGFSGFAQNAFAALADPINLVGFGSGAIAAKTAARSAANLTQKQILGRAASRGAITEGIVGTGVGGVQESLQQGRDLATGIRDEFDVGELAFAAGVEGGLSAGLGGLFGLAGGAAATQARAGAGATRTDKVASAVLAPARATGRGLDAVFGVFGKQFTLQAENARLAELGFSADDIQYLVDKGAARENIAMILKNNLARDEYFGRIEEGNVEGLDLPDADEIAAVGEDVTTDPRFPNLPEQLSASTARIQSRQVELQEDLRQARETGDTENEKEVLKELATVSQMEGLATRIGQYEAEIAADFESPNKTTRDAAAQRALDLRKLIADFENFSRSGDSASAQAVQESAAVVEAASPTPRTEAAPVETPAQPAQAVETETPPAETTELPADMFSTKAVRGMAQNAGLTEEDFANVTPTTKGGKKYNVKDVRAVIASKGNQPAAEPATSQPVEVVEPETTAPETGVEPDSTKPVDDSPIEFIYMEDGEFLLPGYREKTSGAVIVRLPDDQSAVSLPQEAAGPIRPLTPDTINYRSENQRQAVANVLSQLGKTEEDLAEAIAHGTIPVSKDGTIKQIKRPNLVKALTQFDDVEAGATPDTTYTARAEKVLQELYDETDGMFCQILQQAPDVARLALIKKDPEQGERIFNELMEAVDEDTVGKTFNKDNIQGNVELTGTEQKKVKQLTKNMMANGLPEPTARIAAVVRVLKERGKPIEKTSGDLTGTLANPPTETTAGRSTFNRIQSFLKRGEFIGRAPSVPEGLDPDTKTIYGYDNAVAAANKLVEEEYEVRFDVPAPTDENPNAMREVVQTKTRLVPNTGVQVYVSTGGERIADGQGTLVPRAGGKKNIIKPEHAKKGETYFYDPITNKAYKHEANMRMARGEGPNQTHYTSTDVPVRADKDIIKTARAQFDEDGDLRAFAQALKQTGKNSLTPVASDIPDVPVLSTNGKRLALRNKETGKIRVIGQNQIDEGKGIEALLGKADIEDFEIGHTKGARNSQVATEQFEVWSPNKIKRPYLTAQQASQQVVPLSPAKFVEEIDGLRSLLDAMPLPRDRRVDVNALLDNLVENAGEVDKLSFVNAIDYVEMSVGWPRLGQGDMQKTYAEFFAGLQTFRSSIVPEDVRYPGKTIAQSQKELKAIGRIQSEEELAELNRVLRTLSESADDMAPGFIEGEGDGLINASTSRNPLEQTNQIELTRYEGIKPSLFVTLHELGHWAYKNILTPEDKLNFWNTAQKYIDQETGTVRDNELATTMFNLGENPGVRIGPDFKRRADHAGAFHYGGADGLTETSNAMDSPQEWFANQFASWAMNERLAPEFRQDSFWNKTPAMRKISRYVKSIVDFFINKKNIDPDLVPLFSKILPDNLQAAALHEGVMEPVTDAGKALHRVVEDLTMYHEELLQSVISGNDDSIVFNAQMLANRLYGLAAPQQARSNKYGESGKPFMLLGRTHKIAQTLYQRIYDAMGRDISTLSVSDAENLGFSYDAVSRNVTDDAERIIEIVKGNRTADVDPRFETEELIATIINDARKKFNELSDEPVKMHGGYAGISFAPKKELKGYAKYTKQLRDGKRKKQRKQDKITKETRKNADVARTNKSPTVAQIDDGQAINYRTATPTQLADELGKYGETDYGKQVARQMKENERAHPISNEVEPQLIDSKITLGAIEMEIAETQGISGTSISPGARAGLNVAQEKLSHRDPDKLNIMRTVFYRMANLTGAPRPTNRIHLAMMGVSDVNDVARRIDTSDPNSATPNLAPSNYLDEQIDVDSQEFSELRKKLRSLATNLSPKSEGAVGQKNAKAVVQDVITAVVIMDPTQTLHRDIWRRTFGTLAQGGQGKAITQENWDMALRELVVKTSKNMAGTDPYENLDPFVHTVKQHVAYILNGQMDKRIKQAHPSLDAYGNVFTSYSHTTGITPNIDQIFYPSRYDDEATGDLTGMKRTTEAFWNNSSQNRKDAINAFTGNTDPNNPPPLYILSTVDIAGKRPHVLGERGLMPQIMRHDRYGNGIMVRQLATQNTQDEYYESLTGPLRDGGATDTDLDTFNDLLEIKDIMDDTIMTLKARKVNSIETSTAEFPAGLHYDKQIDEVYVSKRVVEDQIDDMLKKFNVLPKPRYHPVYLGKANFFDFTIDRDYGLDDIPAIRQIMAGLDTRDAVDVQSAINMIESRGYITGDALHMEFIDAIMDATRRSTGRAISRANASTKLNKVLQDIGYDGLKGHEERQSETMFLMFEDKNNIKHAMAGEFDDSRDSVGYIFNKDEVSRTNARMINTMAEQGQLNEGQTVTMEEQLRDAGVSANAAAGIGNMARGKLPNGRQQSAIRRAFNVGFGENSHNLRRFGLTWLADWIAPARMEGTGHYERLAARTSNHISPIFEALAGLQGGGGIKNWLRKASDFNIGKYGIHHALGVDQPRSYLKIVNAVRRGPESEAVKNLNPGERFAYKKVREMFRNIHYELTEAGVMVGTVKDYFPQVWSVEKILRDPENFKLSLARYFISEGERFRDEALTIDTALAKADSVYRRLVEEDGVYTPPEVASARENSGDHIDYQRLIRLDEFKEHLDDVGQYLENDLEAIISKYADNAVRRIDLAEKYGNEMHGFHDYMKVVAANDMATAIGELLSKKKVSKKVIVNANTDYIDDKLEIRRESRMPFEGDEVAAQRAAQQLIALASKGEVAMRQFMDSFDTARGEPAFSKRIDAIIGAILDRQNMNGPLDRNKERFAQGTLDSLQRKGMAGYGIFSDYGHRTSKVMRNFNAITLLGSTVFTSFGDMILPLVRSGSLKAFTKGLGQYMTNPHYRKMTRNIGAALENQIHERMTGLYGADSSRNTVAFFNATLLSPWTGFWRSASSAVGHEWFKAEYAIALTNFNPRLDLAQQNRKFKSAYRILRAYGLDELLATNQRIDDFDSFIPDPSDSPQRADAKQRVQEAIIKFSNQTIFTPNANDIPLLAQSPIGQLIFQLKSFPLMMSRMGYDATRLAVTADPMTGGGRRISPALMLATVAPLAGGAGANLIKDYVQARGEDDTRQPRDRSFNQIAESMGWDARLHGEVYGIDADKFMGWYIEGMVQMGGLGLFADILYQTAEQADNGVYGAQRILSVFGGPTAGAVMDGITFGQGVFSDENYKQRQAARIAATRIPVLGGYRDVRSGIVDAVAGPKKRIIPKSSFMQNWAKPK